ncbi:helix-turn-helix domain-containing protein [Blastococcus sp. SYSU DS0753]
MTDPVREAREELIRAGLLGDVPASAVVPDLVLRSWRRSIGGSVQAAALAQRYREVEADSVLRRAADPVLDRWQEQLTGTGTTLFLSDRAGNIVARRASDSGLRRQLDRVNAAEGFDYSEESVGTNGLGTSMVERRAVYIEGSQHYNDALATLACAAAPVCAPTGAVVGSVSVGGPLEVANPLMLTVTQEIGRQIEERLRAASRPEDLALAMSFMRYANSSRPTVVMDSASLLANNAGVPYIDVGSRVVLWELLSAHDWSSGRPARFPLEGTGVEVTARRVLDGPRAHFVAHFDEVVPVPELAAVPVRGGTAAAVREEVDDRGGVAVVEGPRGSGRATRVRLLQAQAEGSAVLREVVVAPTAAPPWDEVTGWLSGGTDVLLRRVEDLPDRDAPRLVRLVADLRAASSPGALWLTVSAEDAPPALQAIIDEREPVARTQALARTPERIPGLVRDLLEEADPQRRHTVSPAALQALVQWSWPGNLAELVETVATLVRDVPASVIERRHLPRRLQRPGAGRTLGLMESAEREAIVSALQRSAGNKSEAAELLGIGRTTLYRKMRQHGLDDPESLT